MIEDQVITVTNKAQLLVAFGCALDFGGTTRITLVRKTGKTFYRIVKSKWLAWYDLDEYNKCIRRARAKIRQTPAVCFR